ncbi:GNAT family N-acetyltransferase [Mycolicibacterium holsaticum]|uniref:GNAT family N-acetyltransferase n=1 Tax=Mycolicibacterium holsaticum TaxID=152142 RepID=UPI001C7CAE05|nr:GNAT family N-acetyltransferase [Mycolicibacterium holsaticum]MDA4106038.1 hypothetical protein [Mycolicibacterium holsaticum DSM 44478 = JCM 12374]QZA13632.1 GNAT family N-acetyltransferase [Mycolicibacterium holsaticum DSM 44478 = JCM 12374]UNC08905.1 GNAT family N-acetyltransferase [Mycolicibacterium holsaticum DSM 44478 = JCM 12374]
MIPDDLVIRKPELTDLYRVAMMHIEAWRDCYAGMVPQNYLDELDPITWMHEYRRLMDIGRTMLLAESAGTPVGVAIFGSRTLGIGHVEIDALYIARDRQGDGIGPRLLHEVLGYQEYTTVSLECATDNQRGCRFWEASGFRFTGETGSYPIPGAEDLPTNRYIRDINGS